MCDEAIAVMFKRDSPYMSEIHTEIFRDEIRYLEFTSQYLGRDKE